MKTLTTAAGAFLLAANLVCVAQSEGVCGQTLEAPFQSNALLAIDSLPAGLEIVGTDEQTIHVTCTSDYSDNRDNIHLRLTGASGEARLAISGGYAKHGSIKIRVEVPRKTSLRVQMPAGEVKINEITGNKDVALYAGQITISSMHAWNYSSVNASVAIGEVNARVYGTDKGGFFRTFSRSSSDGEYRLRAHVMTGEIDLVGGNSGAGGD